MLPVQLLNLAFTGKLAYESSFQGRTTVENSMFSWGRGAQLPEDSQDELRGSGEV
jgi:hypothetical protein